MIHLGPKKDGRCVRPNSLSFLIPDEGKDDAFVQSIQRSAVERRALLLCFLHFRTTVLFSCMACSQHDRRQFSIFSLIPSLELFAFGRCGLGDLRRLDTFIVNVSMNVGMIKCTTQCPCANHELN